MSGQLFLVDITSVDFYIEWITATANDLDSSLIVVAISFACCL